MKKLMIGGYVVRRVRLTFIMIALLFTSLHNAHSTVALQTSCDLIPQDAIAEIPQEILDSLSKIIVYNKDKYFFSYLFDDEPLYSPPATIREHPKLQPTLLSPSGNYAANQYGSFGNSGVLRVTELSTGLYVNIPVDKYPDSFDWLDATSLLIITRESDTLYRYEIHDVDEAGVLRLKLDWSQENIFPTSMPILSPDRSRIALMYENGGDVFVIYDISEAKIISSASGFYGGEIIEQGWSNNSMFFAIAWNRDFSNSPQSIRIYEADGETFADFQITAPPDSTRDAYNLFRWSPTSDYFFYKDTPTKLGEISGRSVMLINMSNNDRLNICVPGEALWSQDGRLISMFVFDSVNYPVNTLIEVYIYDLQGNDFYKLEGHDLLSVGEILGWGAA